MFRLDSDYTPGADAMQQKVHYGAFAREVIIPAIGGRRMLNIWRNITDVQ
jgi:hypothetical protein